MNTLVSCLIFMKVSVCVCDSVVLALFLSMSLAICLLFRADILFSSTKTDRGMGNIQKPFRNHNSPVPGRERFVSINGRKKKNRNLGTHRLRKVSVFWRRVGEWPQKSLQAENETSVTDLIHSTHTHTVCPLLALNSVQLYCHDKTKQKTLFLLPNSAAQVSNFI